MCFRDFKGDCEVKDSLGSDSTGLLTWLRSGKNQIAVAALLMAIAYMGFTMTSSASGVFDPTIKMERSTTRATAHPDARITIDSSSGSEDIKNITIKLPTGFWGSLAAASKCSASSAVAGTCGPTSQVGTVVAEGTVDGTNSHVDAKLRGKVYLTDPVDPTGPTGPTSPSQTDPAGLSIKVDAKIGGVDMGSVIVNGRVSARYGPTTLTGNSLGPLDGIDTSITNLPRSVTDPNLSHGGRTVNFHLTKTTVDLISDLDGPNPPLLTNPSKCSTTQLSASFTGYDGGSVPNATDSFVTDHCETVNFSPTAQYDLENTAASSTGGMKATVSFPTGPTGQPPYVGSLKDLEVKLPQFTGVNFGSITPTGTSTCSGATINVTGSEFTGSCPLGAKIGTIKLTTPLLPNPLIGNVLLINTAPVPSLGINISPSTNAGNPKGITIRIAGINSTPCLDVSEAPATCGLTQQLQSKFTGLPDAPATKIELDLEPATRPGTTADTDLLVVTDPGTQKCVERDDFETTFTGTAGANAYSVESKDTSGCQAADFAVTSGPVGQVINSSSAAFKFTDGTAATAFLCSIDALSTSPDACAVDPASYSKTGIADGVHRVFFQENPDGGNGISRGFAVDTATHPSDVTVPNTTLVTPPSGSITDTTPSFTFHSTEDSTYQCSLDGGAFLPCGSATSGTANTSYTIPDALAYAADDASHTLAVRAQDTAGNVDLTPDSASFTVNAPAFGPSFTAGVSDTQARAHPDLTLTIDNPSNQNIKGLSFSLPDGFLGSLRGVQSLCSVTDANAGTCTAASKAGTVTATATVDESQATITGGVYLTEKFQDGDPAGMVIIIDPTIQDIVVDPIVVRARLTVRGKVKGIDTATFDDIPQKATTNFNEDINFKAHKFVIHLGDQVGAPDHLLVNASDCTSSNFAATFTGWSGGTASPVQEYHATGCAALPFSSALTATISKTDGSGTSPTYLDAIQLDATVNSAASDSAIKNARVVLPQPVNIDPTKIPFACDPVVYADGAGVCPANSKIGTAVATSPLLPEALQGEVYMLKIPGGGTPNIVVRLHGRISIDLVGVNSFVNNQTQLQSSFTDLPDVPLSSFSLSIGTFLQIAREPCEYKGPYAATGQLESRNGATAAVNSPLDIRCNGFMNTMKFKQSGKKTTLNVASKPEYTNKYKRFTLKLPKGLTLVPKAIAKKVIVKVDGKKLKAKCFKASGKNKLVIGFCGKQAGKLEISFKAGSLVAVKKSLKKSKLSITAAYANGKDASDNVALGSKSFETHADR